MVFVEVVWQEIFSHPTSHLCSTNFLLHWYMSLYFGRAKTIISYHYHTCVLLFCAKFCCNKMQKCDIPLQKYCKMLLLWIFYKAHIQAMYRWLSMAYLQFGSVNIEILQWTKCKKCIHFHYFSPHNFLNTNQPWMQASYDVDNCEFIRFLHRQSAYRWYLGSFTWRTSKKM